MPRYSPFSGKNLPSVGMLLFIVMIFTIIIPLILLYGFNGFENFNNVIKYILYVGIAGFVTIWIAFDQLTENRRQLKWLDSYLHNPEKGIFNMFAIVRNPIKLALFSIVIFGLFGIASVITNTFFIKTPGFQITEIAAVGLNMEPAASSETLLFFGAIMPIFYGISKAISKKNKLMLVSLMIIFIIINGVVLWPLYHRARYGSDEEELLGVMFFGLSSSIITATTGSIIPTWIWHLINNGLHEAKSLFSSEPVAIAWGIIWLILAIIITIVLFTWKEKKKRRRR